MNAALRDCTTRGTYSKVLNDVIIDKLVAARPQSLQGSHSLNAAAAIIAQKKPLVAYFTSQSTVMYMTMRIMLTMHANTQILL